MNKLVSFYTVESNISTKHGYGYAGDRIRDSLTHLGHEVKFHDASADFQINFCQPNLYSKTKAKYNIGYTPWESTEIPPDWRKGFEQVDEVWTTSPWCKEQYLNLGVKQDVKVFEHGVDSIWSPKKRRPDGVIKFLHVGEPAPRKAGQMAMEAFVAAFKYRDDVSLTIKSSGPSAIRVYSSSRRPTKPRNILGLPHEVYKNVRVIEDKLSLEDLVSLYHEHDVLVYPSWGEGFGLIPLQALATGMPTICTGSWAPYSRFLGSLFLESRTHSSPWPDIHPGNMYEPSFEHLVELYRKSLAEFEGLTEEFYNQAETVHQEYNWHRLTKNAFEHLT